MKSIERGTSYESFETTVGTIAAAYGFSTPPVGLSKKTPQGTQPIPDKTTADIATLTDTLACSDQTEQSWGVARHGSTSTIVFAIASPKHAIAQAFAVKASLAVAESAGYSDMTVFISSIGDQESRRRFLRELGNFFKRHAKALPEHIADTAEKNPEEAMQLMIDEKHELVDSLPRTIDFLSENSRKTMLQTVSLFESLGINYELSPRLPYTPNVNHELLFVVEGTSRKGVRERIASGGRFDEYVKRHGENSEVIGMGISVPDRVDARLSRPHYDTPVCFVVHIGEAAKVKAFCLLDTLLQSKVALGQAILASTMQEQMDIAHSSGAKYVTVIGQREALDGTVIVRNLSTQIQEVIPAQKLPSRLARVRA